MTTPEREPRIAQLLNCHPAAIEDAIRQLLTDAEHRQNHSNAEFKHAEKLLDAPWRKELERRIAKAEAELAETRAVIQATEGVSSDTTSELVAKSIRGLCGRLTKAEAETAKWKRDCWDTIKAIGLALGLPEPPLVDSAEPLSPEWAGKMSEKVAALRVRMEAAETKAQSYEQEHDEAMRALGYGVDDERWKPGETVVGALVRERDAFEKEAGERESSSLANNTAYMRAMIELSKANERAVNAEAACDIARADATASAATNAAARRARDEALARAEKAERSEAAHFDAGYQAGKEDANRRAQEELAEILAICQGRDPLPVSEHGTGTADKPAAQAVRKLEMARFQAQSSATAAAMTAGLCNVEVQAALAKVAKLQAFKAFVHRRLDEIGIATEPNGRHSAEGCRVGDRLDIVQARLTAAAAMALALDQVDQLVGIVASTDNPGLQQRAHSWLHTHHRAVMNWQDAAAPATDTGR